MTRYRHARYEPIDTGYMFIRLVLNRTADSCICLCLSNRLCSMISHFAFNRTCSLYFGQFNPQELRVAPEIWNATFYDLGNSSATSE